MLSIESIGVIGGLLINLIAVIGFSNKLERRLTKLETLTSILVSRSGIHTRSDDNLPPCEGVENVG